MDFIDRVRLQGQAKKVEVVKVGRANTGVHGKGEIRRTFNHYLNTSTSNINARAIPKQPHSPFRLAVIQEVTWKTS